MVSIRDLFKRFRKKPTVTTKVLAPKKEEPVRAVDVGTPTQERVGGIVIRGEAPRTSGGDAGRTTEAQIIQRVIESPKEKITVTKLPPKPLEEIKPRETRERREKLPEVGAIVLRPSEVRARGVEIEEGEVGIIPAAEVRGEGISVSDIFLGSRKEDDVVGRTKTQQAFDFAFKGLPSQRQEPTLTPLGERLIGDKPRAKQAILDLANVLRPEVILASSFPAQRVPQQIALRATREAEFLEVQIPIVKGGKEFNIGRFEIITEKTPPLIQRTKEGGFLDGKLVPPKIDKTVTPFTVIDEKPFVTLTTKGGRVGKLAKISGVSKEADILALTPREKFLFTSLKEKELGFPVAEKNIQQFFKKDAILQKGFLEEFQLGKVRTGKPTELDILPPKTLGRRTRRFETVSEFKPLGETDQFEILGGRTVFKDVTFPGTRDVGKLPSLKGTVIRLKKPIVLDTETGVQALRPSGKVTRTPLEKTFQQQIQKDLVMLPKPLPQPKPIKTKASTKIVSKPIATQQIISKSAFEGKGLFERTEGGLLPGEQIGIVRLDIKQKPLVSGIDLIGLRTKDFQGLFPFQKGQPKLRGETKTQPKEITKQFPKEITKIFPKQIFKPAFKSPFKIPPQPRARVGRKPTTRRAPPPFLPFVPSLEFFPTGTGRRATRLFIETPKFFDVKVFEEFGIGKIETGILLPTTLLKKVKKTKRRKKKK